MKKHFWQGLPLLLVLVAALIIWQDRQTSPSNQPKAVQQTSPGMQCVSLNAGCTTRVNGVPLSTGVNGRIQSMQPFEVWVKSSSAGKVEARFAMQAMNMGINSYTLIADQTGVYRATVTLAGCISGDRNWLMTLNVNGTSLSVPFVMDP